MGNIIKLNNVLAPQWYWKAVCDPVDKQSIFFWGDNTIADTADNPGRVKGCFDILQQKKNGVINCFSLKDAKEKFKKDFKIPEFHEKNCVPSTIGTNFRAVLEASLK